MSNILNDVRSEMVKDALKESKQEIKEAVLDTIENELCYTCLENMTWLNSREAAHLLKIKVSNLHNECYKRKIKYQKVGKRSEFHIDWINEYRTKNAKVFEPID